MKKAPPKSEPRPVVSVAYRGILADFKLYQDKDGVDYVKLPDGTRAYVEARRDGTYMVKQ